MRIASSALVGGIGSVIQGGKFLSGFLSAGFSAGFAATKFMQGAFSAGKMLVSSMVGGVASVLGGGKFKDGAVTGALAYATSHGIQKLRSEFSISPQAQQARALKKASEFTIGDKEFEIKGGTLAEKLKVQTDLTAIFSTPRGAQMLAALESRRFLWFFKTDFVIDLTVTNTAYTFVGADTIYVDPSFHPTIQTTAGPIAATTQRILAHELGHAAMNFTDSGTNNMNNVTYNENPVMNALGQPSRTVY